jgi:hypothetical protein
MVTVQGSKNRRSTALRFTPVGNLENGRAVYKRPDGALAIEADHRYIVEPTAEDEKEIYIHFPQLKPQQ